MELGEKLRRARLEAGLTQRQLCGEEITRNMLSQIEHGTAMPSVGTLQYLAGRLGKSVSFFLDEESVLSPNQQMMEQARASFDAGDYKKAVQALAGYRGPDPVYHREYGLLLALSQLGMAERALEEGKTVLARELLNKLEVSGCYCAEALQRRRLLLLLQAGERNLSSFLPSLDEELLLRAGAAFEEGNILRTARLLDAVEDQTGPKWNLLRGQVYLTQSRYAEAAACLHRAEEVYPKETAFRLEQCYRELEDYKRAYEYACKQKSGW